jgi:mxaJ protein
VKHSSRAIVAAVLVYVWTLGTVSTQSTTLRICGDPDNLPYSNDKLEGFDNKIAAIVAADLGSKLDYTWYPHQMGLIRNTIDAEKCDVVFGVPEGLDRVTWTKPYYRTSYVLAQRAKESYRITSFEAPELKTLKLGVYENTPADESLARRGHLNNVSTYQLFFDPRGNLDRPGKMLDDLMAGKIDVAIPWGPVAGYYAKRLNAPILFVPLQNDADVPLTFEISMGVHKGNTALKTRLESAIDRKQTEIRAILEDYGVPLLPLMASAAPAGRAQAQEQVPGGAAPPAAPDAAPAPASPDAAAPAAPASAAPAALGTAADGSKKLNPFLGKADMITEGRALYFKLGCQGCHGGGGGGGMAAPLIDDAWKFGSDDQTLYNLIKGQIPRQTMPTAYSNLPDDEIWKMLSFIRSVYAGDPAKVNW